MIIIDAQKMMQLHCCFGTENVLCCFRSANTTVEGN